jgi:iron(III) transport system ATP-binding protein
MTAPDHAVTNGTRPPPAHPEAAGAPPVVRLRGLTKRFRRADGTVVVALDDVSLDVPAREVVVLVGPSGCGKTTLLRAIAGLEPPDRGVIEIHGEACFDHDRRIDQPPERRKVSMVFQNYALWPHLTAVQNVAYPLRADRRTRLSRSAATARAGEMLAVVGIGDLGDQHPHQMSGGQRQRVALARALVAGSDVVLFDEPLSNVDARVRSQLRAELLAMQRRLGFSAVFVTHDQAEAMELADLVAVMGHGRVAQLGSPREVYDRPATPYVARFIGSTNELAGTVRASTAAGVTVDAGFGVVHGLAGGARLRPGQAVIALWRPQASTLTVGEPATANRWPVELTASRYLGTHTEHTVRIAGRDLVVWQAGSGVQSTEGAAGDAVWLGVAAGDVRVLATDDHDERIDGTAEGRP